MVILLLVAMLVAGALLTISAFTSSTAGGASIDAADLVFALAPSGTVVDTTAMKPGDTRTGSVTLTNQKAAATFTLGFAGLGSGTLAGVLQLTVTQTAPVTKQLYSGALASAPLLQLGKIASGGTVHLSLAFAWPSGSRDAALQGQSIPLVLQWGAQT